MFDLRRRRSSRTARSKGIVWALRFGCAMAMASLAAIPLGCSRGEASSSPSLSKTQAEPVKVSVAPVKFRESRQTVDVLGTIRGWEEISVGAKHGGRIIKVHHDMSDRVKAGEPLADLETIDAELSVEQAQRRLDADLAQLGLTKMPDGSFDPQKVPAVVQAKLSLERAEIVLRRENSLRSRNVGNAEQLQFASNDRESASAALSDAILKANALVASARVNNAALQTAKQTLADMKIVVPKVTQAPDGVKPQDLVYAIRRRMATEGQMIASGESVFELVIEDPLRLWANVPSVFAPRIKEGQDAELRVIAYPDQTFPAKVTRISPATDPLTRAFQVELEVPNPDRKLKPGDFAKVAIITGVTDDAPVVPVESIVRFAGNTKVFLVEDNIAHERKLQRALAVEKTPSEVEIQPVDSKPIPKNSQVIITGQGMLADGDRVTIRPPHQFSDDAKKPSSVPSFDKAE